MNVFTNLLFLQDHLAEPHLLDDQDERFSQGYGNRVASQRFFAPLGHARAARQPQREARQAPKLDADLAVCGCG